MTVLLQHPDEVLNYTYNWGSRLDGAIIASSVWTIAPSDGVTLTGDSHTDETTTVFASGLVNGQVYRLVNIITTSTGTSELKTIAIRCEG